jgi:hypothetical protein
MLTAPGRIRSQVQILWKILRHQPARHMVPPPAPHGHRRQRRTLHVEKSHVLRHRHHHGQPHRGQLRPHGNQKPHHGRSLPPRL